MPIIVIDAEISALMAEQKILSTAWREESPVITKRDDRQRSVQVSGEAGREFVVIARQDQADRNNFSLVLASVVDAETRRLVRLRRYDGGSRRHRNRIEHERVTGCHIHQATERFQRYANAREDGFAVATAGTQTSGKHGDVSLMMPTCPRLRNCPIAHSDNEGMR